VTAHDLAILGYTPVIYEAEEIAGGQLVYGVQDWRLPRDMVAREVQDIVDLGVEIILNTQIGRDIKFNELWSLGYEAIFIGVGFMKSRMLQLPGSDGPGVAGAVELIQEVCRGKPVEIGKRVVVIGGGAVATDAARLAIRYGADKASMICLESFEEMPAPAIEIEESIEEFIDIHNRLGPYAILRDDAGNITGMQFTRVLSVFDDSGRFNPVFDETAEKVTFPCDMVIFAVGQASDLSFLDSGDGVDQSRPGVIAIDPRTFATTAPGVFAGGDIAIGPNIIITCEEHGHIAARSIHQYLSGKRMKLVTQAELTIVDPKDYLFPHYINTPRQTPAFVDPHDRLTPQRPVPELGFTEEEAMLEGQRCLQCHIQTVFDGDLCVMCNGCVDACPTYCLKMVKLNEIDGDQNLGQAVFERYGLPLSAFQNANPDDPILDAGTVMLKDEDRCIRCGLCAEICPTGAVTMEALHFEERWVPA
jgi:thioredoxin reductase/ferredoxin